MGEMWVGSKRKNQGISQISVGDVIICEASLASGVLKWQYGNKFKEYPVPKQMRGKSIYLSIIMRDEGDEVDVSLL
jgi:hypothetical protein